MAFAPVSRWRKPQKDNQYAKIGNSTDARMNDMNNPEWLDRQYNNRALVPEHQEHFRRWAAESAEAMRSHPRELDLRYGGGPNEHMDIFPAPGHNAPVMVFIHGGYWRSLDKREHSFVAPPFTQEGVCVVVPNYALCPAVTIPEIVMQLVRALAWTWRNVARHGGDPGRIYVAGHSAGGQLAAMMLSCVWQAYDSALPADLVKGALSISGVHDLRPLVDTPFLKESLRLAPEDASRVSPAMLPAPTAGPIYTVAGGNESDEFRRQNGLLRQAWGDRAVPVCELLPGLNHFSILETIAGPTSRLRELALQLVRG
jgi:arylformamidase